MNILTLPPLVTRFLLFLQMFCKLTLHPLVSQPTTYRPLSLNHCLLSPRSPHIDQNLLWWLSLKSSWIVRTKKVLLQGSMVLLLHIKYVLIFPLNSKTATTNYLQFHQPTQVLANHWSRNGAPHPLTSHNPPPQSPALSLTPSQHNARPCPHLRQVPAC